MPRQSLYQPKRPIQAGWRGRTTAISSAEAFEAVTEEILPTFTFDVDLAGIGVSLVNRRKWFLKWSTSQWALEVRIQ